MLGELNEPEIDAVLRQAVVGRIGCHAEGCTYIVPISYAYDGDAVYGHSASGSKVQMMRANPSVCFEVEEVDDLANWRSVIGWGSYEELTGEDAAAGMRVLLTRFAPLVTSVTAEPHLGPDGTVLPGPAPEPKSVPKPGPGPRPKPGPGTSVLPPDHAAAGSSPHAVIYRIRLTEKTGRFEKA
ncbi:pyridoxamine 5'-phosphate oxidase family protein [Cryobacterium sp. TMT2-10]|nr:MULTISPECIES: pyridoxamine 5'-phosphate oxidase family protein [Cryobacterium]TFD37947.1 pyridoxamine 5'-phosphate oxidase family protein [Cryobacterium sp. TMT2-10]